MKKILYLMAIALPFIFISCGDDKDEPKLSEGHEYVDLGLPSGTLWATCNVGANVPEEYGDYFAWGETKPKDIYDWESNKWFYLYDDSLGYWKVTKYCIESSIGVVDNKTELDPEDDAAYVNWGMTWRMPTLAQQKELIKYCTWDWTTKNGVNGRLVTGPNGKTLFLPAAGFCRDSKLESDGWTANYWSRTLGDSSYAAYYLGFDSDEVDNWNLFGRFGGMPVRAVRVSQN